MNIPNEEHMYQILDELAENCTCTNLTCLHCEAADAIDTLIIHNLINHYRNKRRTWRCHR